MFFNPNPESSDLQLLPAALREDEDLAAIADECEAATLARFTGVLPGRASLARDYAAFSLSSVPTGAYTVDASDGVYVFLRGYEPDIADCEARLAAALKREIAGLIRWRHAQWRMNPTSASESSGQGDKAISYREDKNLAFPPTFGMYLRPFDLRPPAAVI